MPITKLRPSFTFDEDRLADHPCCSRSPCCRLQGHSKESAQ